MLQPAPTNQLDRDGGAADLVQLMLKPAAWLTSVNFNFTNRCNVRCVYCPQGSHAEGFHADSSRGLIEQIKSFIREHDVRRAGIGYYGETLLIKGWEEDCAALLDWGLDLHINSSFNRILSEREAQVLSRFSSIYMSIDTLDIALHREVRKSVDVRNIVYDLHMIRSHAIRAARPMPHVVWTGVMTDKAVFRLCEFVATAVSNGVSAVNFNDLADYDGAKGGVRHIAELEGDELAMAVAEIEAAYALAARHRMPITLGGADRMVAKFKGGRELRTNYAVKGIQGTTRALTTAIKPGETRLCTDPWETVFSDPKGEVYSCCVRGDVMGRLGDDTDLSAVLDNENYRALRLELLTGSNMNETCANCHLRPAVPVAELQRTVAELVYTRKMAPRQPKVSPKGMPPDVPSRSGAPDAVRLVAGEGFEPPTKGL